MCYLYLPSFMCCRDGRRTIRGCKVTTIKAAKCLNHSYSKLILSTLSYNVMLYLIL